MSAAGAATTPPLAWSTAWRKAWPPLALLIAVVLLLHRETALLMVGIWRNSETFAHAFLVPPISLWLIWRQRHALAAQTPRPCWWMLAPIAGAMLLWLAGDLITVNSVTQFALVALIVLCVPLVLGWPATRTILFPLGFLFFAVPVGDFLLPTLMEATADFTVQALTLTGIPVYREGLQFVIPSGNWSIVEACSGVRYLIASLMVGTLFAYLNYRALWRRWVFVGVATVVPIIANWLRAYMIVMLGHLSNNRIAVGVDHLVYGWVFFGIVIMLMFWIGARWAEPDGPIPKIAAGGGGAAAAPASLKAAVAGCALVAGVHAGLWAVEHGARGLPSPRVALPAQMGEWHAVDAPAAPLDWTPHFQAPRARAERAYARPSPEATVGVHVAYFRQQDYESKLVNSMHQIAPADDAKWNRQSLPGFGSGAASWQVKLLQVPPTLSNSRLPKIVVAQTYWVDGRFTPSALEAKWITAVSRLQGRGDDGALVMLHVVDDDAQRGRANLESFAGANLARLADVLGAAHSGRP